jgi:SLT domain-containing protein
MVYDIVGRDSASPAFARAGASAEESGRKISGMVKAIAGFAALDLAAHAVKMAGEFQKLTNVYVTAAGEQQKNLKLVQDGVLKVATNTGTAWQEVAAATYVAEKAGYRAGDAYKVVEASAQGAKEENAKLATVTNAVTSIMASYHLKATDAVKVTDELKTAAGESKVTFEDYAGALSTVLPIASAAKISFADIAGAFATLTQHGTSANESTQELAATVRALQSPNAVAQKMMAQLGISVNDVTQKLGDGPGGRGFAGTLNYLTEVILQKMGPAGTVLLDTFNQSKQASENAAIELAALSPEARKLGESFENGAIGLGEYRKAAKALPGEQGALALQFLNTYTNAKGFQSTLQQGLTSNKTYTATLKTLTGGAIGLNTALQLTGESAKGTAERQDRIAESAKNAGKEVSGWASTQKLFSTQMDIFKQQVEALGIRIGLKLLPSLQKMLKVLTGHPSLLKAVAYAVGGLVVAWAAFKVSALIDSLALLATRILGIGAASTAAAAETRAAGLGSAVGGIGTAGTAGAGTARAAGLTGASRLILPVAITYAALKATGEYNSLGDLLHGDYEKAGRDAPKWAKDLGFKLGEAFVGTFSGQVTPDALAGVKGGKSTSTGNFVTSALNDLKAKLKGNNFAPGVADALKLRLKPEAVTAALAGQLSDVNAIILALFNKGQLGSTVGKQLQFEADAIKLEMAKQAQDLVQAQVNAYLTARAKAEKAFTKAPSQLTTAEGRAQDKGSQAALNKAGNAAGTESFLTATKGLHDYLTAVAKTRLFFAVAFPTTAVEGQNKAFKDAAAQALQLGTAVGVGMPERVQQGLIAHRQNVIDGLKTAMTIPQQQATDALEQLATTGGTTLATKLANAIENNTPLVVSKAEKLKIDTNDQIQAIIKTWGITVTADPSDAVGKLTALQATISGFSAAATAAGFTPDSVAGQQYVQALANHGKLAAGGPVYGPGGPKDDLVPIMASAGEHMWTAEEVAKAGGHGAMYAMRKAIRGYASGGEVARLSYAMNANPYINSLSSGVTNLGAAIQAQRDAASAGAGVQQWAPLVLEVLKMLGQPASGLALVLKQMNLESGGNPNAINNWDSNAAIGQQSRGLMQTVPGTFAAYAGPFAARGIYDPLANIYAGVNYALHRYGGLGIFNEGHGYDSGGILKPGTTLAVNSSGKPEAVLTNAEWKYLKALSSAKALENPAVQGYLKALSEVSKYLKALAAASAATVTRLTTFVDNQKQYRDSLQSTLSSGNTLSDVLGKSGTIGDVKTLLGGKLAELRGFVSKVSSLKKAGWPDAVVREIASDGIGPGSQYADLLLSASPADKKQLIGAATALTANQTAGANLATLLTGGTAGLTKLPAIRSLSNATFTPGSNEAYWVALANKQQGPLIHVQNVNTQVDLEAIARDALFRQQVGSLG